MPGSPILRTLELTKRLRRLKRKPGAAGTYAIPTS